MVCETYVKPKQTAQERRKEIQETIEALQRGMASGQARRVTVSRGGCGAMRG